MLVSFRELFDASYSVIVFCYLDYILVAKLLQISTHRTLGHMFKSVVIFAALSRLSLWTNLLSSRILQSERLFSRPDRRICYILQIW